MNPRPLDIVVYGATGFTGRLVAEHIVRDYRKIKWAIAGRNVPKLEGVKRDLEKKYNVDLADVPILEADASNATSLDNVCRSTKVVLSTAGPFTSIGTPVVDAAVRNGTHYCDITGEVDWVRKMVEKHHDAAAMKNVRIVPCCGFDSIPFDMGAYMVAEHAKKLGKTVTKIVNILMKGKGSVSGGTVASGLLLFSERAEQTDQSIESNSVYSLVPGLTGKDAEFWGTEYNKELGVWLGAFVMQAVNARVVHRSNYFLKWNTDLRYQEGVAAPSWWGAKAIDMGTKVIIALFSNTWLHPFLKMFLPAQGEGPSWEKMVGGHYYHKTLGYTDDNHVIIGNVADPNRDAGYWGTSRMLLESGLCLALDMDKLEQDKEVQKGGVLTPASSMGHHLLQRLRAADIQYDIEEVRKL